MLKSWETPLNTERNPLQCNDVREHGISHDVASHQSSSFILKADKQIYVNYFYTSFFGELKNTNKYVHVLIFLLKELSCAIDILVNNFRNYLICCV